MLSDCAEQEQSKNVEVSTDELVIANRVGSVKCAGSLPNKIGECFFVNNVKAECAEDDSSGASALPVNSSTALNAIISTNKASIPNMASCATFASNSDAVTTTSVNCRRGILLLPMSVNGDQTMCRVFTCNLQANVATDSG